MIFLIFTVESRMTFDEAAGWAKEWIISKSDVPATEKKATKQLWCDKYEL